MPAPRHPGQPPWSDRGGPNLSGDTAPIRSRPDRAAPVHFHAERPRRQQNSVLMWVLRGLGLVAVAVISGLVWWYVHDDGGGATAGVEPTSQQRTGQFEFTPLPDAAQPRRESNCADHAYGGVKTFFQTTPCEQLTRAIYSTTTPDGRKVYINVSVIRMANADQAGKLRQLADTNGTGNVNDLVRDNVVKIPPLRSLSGSDGYNAVQHDRNLIIVEADFDPAAKRGDKKRDEELLDAISVDASLLGDRIGG
ncbi:MAG: hypothetical protein ACJ72N_09770 [Labedaea sp.]